MIECDGFCEPNVCVCPVPYSETWEYTVMVKFPQRILDSDDVEVWRGYDPTWWPYREYLTNDEAHALARTLRQSHIKVYIVGTCVG